ncbi:putative Regulator protein [Streptomyces afghaniensis 772]|uniref:Putative Regulator protein n=1 Tax=Streptomyces afghaniensis 772 TaxID=1283301 RepID=S4M4F3_9ACTN|nr:putative Regulator protein [Streptomyces afghaniensis 772]
MAQPRHVGLDLGGRRRGGLLAPQKGGEPGVRYYSASREDQRGEGGSQLGPAEGDLVVGRRPRFDRAQNQESHVLPLSACARGVRPH